MFQQLVGINIVFYYGAVLWQSVGFSENDALKINILSGSAVDPRLPVHDPHDRPDRPQAAAADRLGGHGGDAGGDGAVLSRPRRSVDGGLHLSDQAGTIALIAANVYVMFFNLSWGPVMWVMLGEMFPNQIRGSGLAVSGFAQWMANFAISVSFPALAAGVGLPVTYGFYALSALVSFFFVYRIVNETRGRELEEMLG